MNNYDFSRLDKFNSDMILSFDAEMILLEKDKNFISKIDPQKRNDFISTYGDNLKDVERNLKLEQSRLIKEESRVEQHYLSAIIKNINNGKSVNSEKIDDYIQDVKGFMNRNFYSYRMMFTYLDSAKTVNDFENITERLNIKKNFENFDLLVFQFVNENGSFKMLDLYMRSKFKIKSLNDYVGIIKKSEELFEDDSFTYNQEDFVRRYGKEMKIENPKYLISEIKSMSWETNMEELKNSLIRLVSIHENKFKMH